MAGELVRRLRNREQELKGSIGRKIKFVERAGTTIKSILIRNDPWNHKDCGRSKCIPCSQADQQTASNCSKRNIVYESSCSECKLRGTTVKYIGESSRSLKERAEEHRQDSKSEDKLSHMRSHWEEVHGGERTDFKFKILKSCRSSSERDLTEAILIKTAGDCDLLNNKE